MLRSGIVGLVVMVLLIAYGLPTFAQTRLAASIPGAPLASIAVSQVIYNSGLPKEQLANGTTNEITKARDAVNAYRVAHTYLSKDGWYRGLSEAHEPLLDAMVEAIELQGFSSTIVNREDRKNIILYKFWAASAAQNAADLGYASYRELKIAASALKYVKLDIEAENLLAAYEDKWR